MSTGLVENAAVFSLAPDSSYWGHELAAPSFVVQEHIDYLTEDEVPMTDLEDADWFEARSQDLAIATELRAIADSKPWKTVGALWAEMLRDRAAELEARSCVSCA